MFVVPAVQTHLTVYVMTGCRLRVSVRDEIFKVLGPNFIEFMNFSAEHEKLF